MRKGNCFFIIKEKKKRLFRSKLKGPVAQRGGNCNELQSETGQDTEHYISDLVLCFVRINRFNTSSSFSFIYLFISINSRSSIQ